MSTLNIHHRISTPTNKSSTLLSDFYHLNNLRLKNSSQNNIHLSKIKIKKPLPKLGTNISNSYNPFYYRKVKNKFLINFNGGSSKKLMRINNEEPEEPNSNREIKYIFVRPCGCFYKNYNPSPRFFQNVEYHDCKNSQNFNKIQMAKYKLNHLKQMPIYPKSIQINESISNRRRDGFLSPRPCTVNRNKLLFNLKQENNRYSKISFQIKGNKDMEKEENENKKDISRNAYRTLYKNRKSFHKTQFFDNCKPYLSDEFMLYLSCRDKM